MTTTKQRNPAAQIALAKKAAAAKAKPAASLIAANHHAPRTTPDTRLLSKAEVCAIAHASYPTLWAWMRAGQFPRSRIAGGRSMWRSDEIDAWLAELPIRPLKGDGGSDLQNGGDTTNMPGIRRLLADIATAPDEAYIIDLITNNLKATAGLPELECERVNEQITDAVREWREAHAT
jgi:predicted DNA-binding transcriptional regulator AlpA